MERYINSFATENDIQIALQNGELFKPYVAYIEDVDRIDWNSKEKVDYTTEYLTFNILSAGTINWTANSTGLTKTIEYKLNDGGWVSITSNTGSSAPTINVVEGDKLQFRGNNAQYATSSSNHNSFGSSTAEFEVEGNIMSLINNANFDTLTTLQDSYTFYSLFKECTGLISAENLVLPATTLADNCYNSMFMNCSSLISAPVLPATTLANNCYKNMFSNCKSLKTAPELPATKLKTFCYNNMFRDCTSLTTAPSILPATTLIGDCYSSMFQNCTSLTTAPELPATKLAIACYMSMFKGCSSLNYIKCLATNISIINCTSNWVSGVSSTGTFVKNPNMTSWTTGTNGIPTGWTVQDA